MAGSPESLLGGQWSFVSNIIRTLIVAISDCRYSYLTSNLRYFVA